MADEVNWTDRFDWDCDYKYRVNIRKNTVFNKVKGWPKRQFAFVYLISVSSSIKHILKEDNGYQVRGTLWIEYANERFFGPGRVELLEKIEASGSISKAAKMMNMSYKKAWEMISSLNKQATMPLVVVKTGGEKGGGSVLTEEAKELIRYHRKLRDRFKEFLDIETRNLTEG